MTATTNGNAQYLQVWRNDLRASLKKRRMDVPRRLRMSMQSRVLELTDGLLCGLSQDRIGFYWPIAGEVDLRPLVGRYIEDGAIAALPVVVKARSPLEFRAWHPLAPMRPGVWKIPIPVERRIVTPTVLLIPLLGFDRIGYRLGNGGGYYDRTIAAFEHRPLLVGVGYELGRLPTIQPQWHDIPMDVIVTEAGIYRYGDRLAILHQSASTAKDNFPLPSSQSGSMPS